MEPGELFAHHRWRGLAAPAKVWYTKIENSGESPAVRDGWE